MGRFYDWMCIDGTEVASADRTAAYVRNRSSLGSVIFTVGACYDCPIINEGEVYTNPAADDAPWYDSNVSASESFLGIVPTRIDLLPVLQRRVSNLSRGGGTIGPLVTKPRILTFTGLMMAYTSEGMAYGDRWVNEVLSGAHCPQGQLSEVELLPSCPEDAQAIFDAGDAELYMRRLVDAGVVDGPVITPIQDGIPECYVAQVAFQIAAGQSHLYSPEISCVDEEPLSNYENSPTCCMVSTHDWPGDAVVNVTLTAETDATDIVLTGTPTFGTEYEDGECPWEGNHPCWELHVPELTMGGIITVDSVRGQIRYRDPTLKIEKSGLRMVTFDGPLTFPEVAPCSNFCLCGTIGSGEVLMSTNKILREL